MTPLVLVHGFMGGSGQWALQEPLARDHALIRLDLPGFGRNAHLPPLDRIGDFAEWVLAELARRGVTRCDLLGHSMGGMIVQEVVHRAPASVARLVLYGTGATGRLPGRFEPIETSIDRARIDGASATARRIAATWFLDRENAPEYEACAAIAMQSPLPAIVAGLEAMARWSGEDRVSDIGCPTLIVWGEHDRTYPRAQVDYLHGHIAGSDLRVVPGCAHAVHLERPDTFNGTIATFLAEPA